MMNIDDIREKLSREKRALEEENAQLRVRIDELMGEKMEWQRKAENYQMYYRDLQRTCDSLRADLEELRGRR